MNLFPVVIIMAITFLLGIYVGPHVNKTQKTINLERKSAYFDSTYLHDSGITSFWKPEGWEHESFSYDLRSWDGGKTWYALEMEKPNSTALKDGRVIILGEVEEVYPGFKSHNQAWDKLMNHVENEGPIDNLKDADSLFEGTGITIVKKDTTNE